MNFKTHLIQNLKKNVLPLLTYYIAKPLPNKIALNNILLFYLQTHPNANISVINNFNYNTYSLEIYLVWENLNDMKSAALLSYNLCDTLTFGNVEREVCNEEDPFFSLKNTNSLKLYK